MEQRKLIKLGNSSFAIALPKTWVDKSGLKKGENVFLEENERGEISVWSKQKKFSDEKITEVNLLDKEISEIRKEIVSAYTQGGTTLHLTGKKDKKEFNEIKDFLKNLISFEVIESFEDKIIAKDFFSLEEANLDNFVKRIDNNIKEMFNVVSTSIKKGSLSKKDLEEVEKIDKDTTKFYFLISRLFFKGIDNPSILNTLKKNSSAFFRDWWFAYNLEHIGDQIKNVARVMHGNTIDSEETKIISETFSSIYETYNESVQSFNKKDFRSAMESAAKGKEILKTCDKLSQSDNVSTIRLATIFRELENNSYQNLKMVMYSGG
ncbi:MAG: PhoU domain-containing protein [Nanoarchaeota archaeon]